MNKVKKLILEHIKRRPESQVQDIYKLLYQGVFGVGHIITERAWDILVEESNRVNLRDHTEDPLLENISPDHSFVRVNLRQFLSQGYSLESLYLVMVKSANFKGEVEVFLGYWNTFNELIENGILDFPLDEIRKLNNMIEEDGIKAQHHSEVYRDAYYPAYRVVLREIIFEDLRI